VFFSACLRRSISQPPWIAVAAFRLLLPVRNWRGRLRLKLWQRRLGLRAYRAAWEATHPLQVTGPDGVPGLHLVGVKIEQGRFTVVYTRPLSEADVVHELLHVARPQWPHEQVEDWTARLIQEPELFRLPGAPRPREGGATPM
jgi:hypothetical protein